MRFKYIALMIIPAAVLCGCKEKILSGVSDSDAGKIALKLAERGIVSERVKSGGEGFDIKVDASRAEEALRMISAERLLRIPEQEIALNLSPMSTREEQVFAIERAQSRQIEKTLMRLRGVVDARVHLNKAQAESLVSMGESNQPQESASALIVVEADAAVDKGEVASLISGSSGISVERVAVVVAPTEPHTDRGPSTGEIKEAPTKLKAGLTSWGAGIIIAMLALSVGMLGRAAPPRRSSCEL